ncbi:261_t:CDS:2 [Entrophospora sp. SA101]|nr:11947_t:CDS:2 [Entrophospora sp. SA101]CAJ0851270.1 261_t:CDS:2 [Entrophospora sp. SA101]
MSLAELETIRWDQNEKFTDYISRFRGLVIDAERVDVTEITIINFFLKSLPPKFADFIRERTTDQKIPKSTLKQVMDFAENNVNEFYNETISESLLSCNKLCKDASEPSVFSKFVDSTDSMFQDINAVSLPGSNEVMKHTVACRRAANMVERDPAFRNSGHIIATKLRQFGEKVNDAGNDLQIMYRKGSFVFETFKIEIEAMMDRLDTQDRNKGEFFRERIKKMTSTVQDFSKKVKIAKDSMLNAENHRDGLEKEILTGIREAEKFIETGYYNSVDLRKAKDGLGAINEILYHLHNTAVHLDEIIKKL